MVKDDPVIAEIRAARSLISAKCDHDPKKVVEYYIKLQEAYRQRLVKFVEPREECNEDSCSTDLPDER